MAFKSIGFEESKLLTPKELTKGDTFEGRYEGQTEGKYGPIYHIKSLNGELISLSKAGNLEYLMNDGTVEEGCNIRVTYLGTEIMRKGKWAGNPAHKYSVEVDVPEVE